MFNLIRDKEDAIFIIQNIVIVWIVRWKLTISAAKLILVMEQLFMNCAIK